MLAMAHAATFLSTCGLVLLAVLCLPGCTLVFLPVCLLVCKFGCLVVQHRTKCVYAVQTRQHIDRPTDKHTESQKCSKMYVHARNILVLHEPEHENAATCFAESSNVLTR